MEITWTTINETEESTVEYGLVFFPVFTSVYHCGSEAGWSDVFSFTALNESASWSPRFTQVGIYDLILSGYAANSRLIDSGRIGDEFMRQIQSIAAYVPYMTCPGNHEAAYKFSNYRNLFSMPGQTESLWNVGLAHIISLSTEIYLFLDYGVDLIFKQYEWLKKDLEVKFLNYRRSDIQKLFTSVCNNTKEIWANNVRNNTQKNKILQNYLGARSRGAISVGAISNPRDWSAFCSTDYGYTRMQVHNTTHLYLEQVSDGQYGKVIDSIWVVKEKHGFSAWFWTPN
uniref:Purple acid phosphatase n=1 Tax=Hucho hucho TaxID=62062 RepID=A0A4W5N6F7_9TELE